MKTVSWLVMVGLVVLLTVPCAAAVGDAAKDGTALLVLCQDAVRLVDAENRVDAQVAYNAGLCRGVILGTLDMYTVCTETCLLPRPLVCHPPGGIGMIQASRIIVRYLETHPARLHLPQGDLILEALHDVFPCPP
jgi:hypothetical protein